MPDEGSFLRAILSHPADDLPRLVYADWCDEQQTDEGSRKAEFLRATAALVMETGSPKRSALERRLMELARHLPTDWLAVVSRLAVENCAAAGNAIRRPLEQIEFEFECPVLWEAMTPTADVGVRHCGACREKVYYCGTIGEAREHAQQGHCVAVDVALPRVEGDLQNPQLSRGVRGKVSREWMDRYRADRRAREEAERISAERVARRRRKK